jgi:hypothetical protein
MAQGLPTSHAPRGSDRDHVIARPLRRDQIELAIFLFALALLALVTGPASAQSRAEVQVAARVVSTEPSRLALALAVLPGPQPRRSQLATVRVAREVPKAPNRRVVSIDFLRN